MCRCVGTGLRVLRFLRAEVRLHVVGFPFLATSLFIHSELVTHLLPYICLRNLGIARILLLESYHWALRVESHVQRVLL